MPIEPTDITIAILKSIQTTLAGTNELDRLGDRAGRVEAELRSHGEILVQLARNSLAMSEKLTSIDERLNSTSVQHRQPTTPVSRLH